ncbi:MULTISPECIES: PD-(D/E)XK nuclease-like domain-containing protein [Shewanella]|uniref:PD-(D/E)XK nuclease-like domain-containing protein n=1 Tax=Shewanella TaxID=22 RepID=UPI000B342E32|nr:PD-(D/E)XK nuclease-like domain-containing protein [Shewanella putrefaciens]
MSVAINLHQQVGTHDEWLDFVQPGYDSNGKANFLDANGELVEGIYTDIENEVYHALDAQSSTGIKTFAKGRHHYYRQYLSDVCRARTKQQTYTFDAGTYGHMRVLEPHNFHGKFLRNPVLEDFEDLTPLESIDQLKEALAERGEAVSGSKAVLIERLHARDPNVPIFEKLREKAIVDFLRLHYPKFIYTNDELNSVANLYGIATTLTRDKKIEKLLAVSPDQLIFENLVEKHVIDHIVWDDAKRVEKSTRAHPKADWLFSDGYPELTVIARCKVTGMMLKVRFDWLRFDAIAVDLKTTQSTNPTKFAYQVKDLRYDLQQVFYTYVANLVGIPVEYFCFVATEYKDADNCETYELSQKMQMESREEMFDLLNDLKDAFETQNWYGLTKSRATWVIEI